jgi:hypothetical protein
MSLPSSSIRPLSELEQLKETGEVDARALEDPERLPMPAQLRQQRYIIKLRKKTPHNHMNHHFAVGDTVKLKKHNPRTLQFNWKSSIYIVGLSYPGTYYCYPLFS